MRQPFVDYYLGLDLGKSSDYSALSVLERRDSGRNDGHGKALFTYDVVTLQRSTLGSPYPKIVQAVTSLVAQPELRRARHHEPDPWTGAIRIEPNPDPTIVIDATGVGVAVVDMFLSVKMPAKVIPVTITSGGQAREDRWGRSGTRGFWTPKIEIVGCVQCLLQTGRLRVAPGLELADTLKKELLTFETRITQSANEQFGTWREGQHDDLVLSVALAAWVAERPSNVCEIGPYPFSNWRG